jgi:hypothetical protein
MRKIMANQHLMGGSNVATNTSEINFEDGTVQSTAGLTVEDTVDLMQQTAGQTVSYTSPVTGLVQVLAVMTAVAPLGPYPQAQVNINLAYTDNTGPQFTDGALAVLDNGQPQSVNEAIFSVNSAPITTNSSFVTFGIAGALPANVWQAPVIVTGPGAAYGATLTQANPDGGCTARFYGVVSLGGVPGNLIYTVLSGTDDFNSTGQVFVDPVSGTHYQASGSNAVGTFTGPGFGVQMTQFVTGAFGPEMDSAPTTVLHIGPQVSGVPNQPSGRIIVPGTAPSLTNAYAWFDPVNGGVFVPTAPWTDAATRITFAYNMHVRIVPVG